MTSSAKTCRARWGSCQGIDWETLAGTASDLFGRAPVQRWHARLEVTIDDTDGYGPDEALSRFRDMADLLAKDMPDVSASVLEGSVYRADAGETLDFEPEQLRKAAPEVLAALQEVTPLLDACARNAERLGQREFAAQLLTVMSANRAAIAKAIHQPTTERNEP